jgi:hypothetical protein
VSASYASRDRCIQALNDGYGRSLEELVAGPVTHRYGRIREFKGGGFYGLTHEIRTPELALHSFTTVMEYTASDKSGTVHHEPLRCYVGAVVPSAAPGSIYVKEIRGFLSKDVYWLPFHRDMKPADVQAKRAGWSPLVDALNRDKVLKALVKGMPDAKTIKGIDSNLKANPFARFDVKVDDEEDNHNTKCQVVPMGNRTLVATQHVVARPEDISIPVKAILRVAEALKAQVGAEPTEGPVVQEWAEQIMKIIARAEVFAPEPRPLAQTQAQAVAQAPAQPSPQREEPAPPRTARKCPRCGKDNGPDNIFCGGCGQPLVAKPAAAAPRVAASPGRSAGLAGVGRMARWHVQLEGGDGAVSDVYVWSLWDDFLVSPQATLGRLLESVQANNHYRWVKALHGVYAPSGQGEAGGYMHLDVGFNMQAQPPFTTKRVQVLAAKQSKGGGFRALGSSEQGLTREQYDALLEAVISRPEVVDDLTLFVPSGP